MKQFPVCGLAEVPRVHVADLANEPDGQVAPRSATMPQRATARGRRVTELW